VSNSGPENQTPQESKAGPIKAGDILLASTTVASLVIALVVFLPDHTSTINVNNVVIDLGGLGLSLGYALLVCGMCALTASIWAVDAMRREAKMPVRSLFVPRTNISYLFYSLIFFAGIYLTVLIAVIKKGA